MSLQEAGVSRSGEKAFQVSGGPELVVQAVFGSRKCSTPLTHCLRCCPLSSTVAFLWFSFLGGFRPSSGEAQGTGALGSLSVPLFFSPSLKMGTTENSRPSKKLPDP